MDSDRISKTGFRDSRVQVKYLKKNLNQKK